MAMLGAMDLQPFHDKEMYDEASPEEFYLAGFPSAFTSLPLSQLGSEWALPPFLLRGYCVPPPHSHSDELNRH